MLERIGGFDEHFYYGEDFDLTLRAAIAMPYEYLDTCVYRVRNHGLNRHKAYPTEAAAQYCEVVNRAFAGRWSLRDRILARRSKAHWEWVIG